jgi:nitroreductase
MKLFQAIEQRRAIKHFDPTAKMTEVDFTQIMNAVLLSPTSYNIQHWRFIRITDTKTRLKIKDAAWGQQQVEDASEVIILCADTQAWSDRPERYWSNAGKSVQDVLLPMLDNFYTDKPQTQRDEAMRSCGMAAQTLMLSAKALGYDTCPMIGFDTQAVADIIKLPEGHVISMMITIGKASKAANQRGGQLPLREVLMDNNY